MHKQQTLKKCVFRCINHTLKSNNYHYNSIRLLSSFNLGRSATKHANKHTNNKSLYLSLSRRNLFVQIAKTPNVLSLKFIPTGHAILPTPTSSDDNDANEELATTTTTLDITSYKDAMNKSGLARELFIIEGIKNVFMTTEFITVTVNDTSKWPEVQGSVVAVINDYLMSGKSVLEDSFDLNTDFNENNDYDDDDEVVAIIRELIDTRIRPNVQYDGGDVIYKGFEHETGVVTLQLVGACKGCESSSETLHNGIERMLTFYVPEVSMVEEFFDEETENLENISQAAFDKVQDKLDNDSATQT